VAKRYTPLSKTKNQLENQNQNFVYPEICVRKVKFLNPIYIFKYFHDTFKKRKYIKAKKNQHV